MKKNIARLLALVLLISSLLCFSSCGEQLTNDDIDSILSNALQNTFENDIYYWKETIVNGKSSTYRQVNSYALTDDENVPVLDEKGNYTDRKIQIVENVNSKKALEIFCGLSQSEKDGEARELLMTETIPEGVYPEKTATPMTAQEFYESRDFDQYRPSTVLSELTYLNASDMDFTVEDGTAETNVFVTELSFKPTEDYLRRYEEMTGEKSMFDGAKRVYLEISYDRIANIITYVDEPIADTGRTTEVERYKFQIVYLGPKFDIPNYTEELLNP